MTEHRRRRRRRDAWSSVDGLRECRGRIEELAGEGRFRVVSARTGETPVPVAGLRFPDRETAAAAASLTRIYRAGLRQWDSETAWLDPVVHERRSIPGPVEDRTRHGTDAPAPGGEP